VEKKDNMPMWVFLAFSSINTRSGALWLIGASALFTLYCIPFVKYFQDSSWIGKVFLIDDWSWFAAMVAITGWYWFSLKWIDNNLKWEEVKSK